MALDHLDPHAQLNYGLAVQFGANGLTYAASSSSASVPAHVVDSNDGPVAVVYGLVSASEARRLAAAVSSGLDPGGPDVPWLVAARRGRHGFAAASSTMLLSGTFWGQQGGLLRVATDPRAASAPPHQLNAAYFRNFVARNVDASLTPYQAVQREPGGRTLNWVDTFSPPTVHRWFAPDLFDEPTLSGEDAREAYLAAFDEVLDELARRAGPIYATVSGGLDSTFIAAGLCRSAAVEGLVHGRTYVPLAEARIEPSPGVDADESSFARQLYSAYPDRMEIALLVNHTLVRPQHAADRAGERAGVPAFNPANQVWLDAVREEALGAGARLLFVGGHGNAAFSHQHLYAARYFLRRGEFSAIRNLARDDSGRLRLALARRRIWRPLAGARRGGAFGPHPLEDFGIHARPRRLEDRDGYLAWLSLTDTSLGAASNPAAMEGLLLADPFAARRVIEVAAAIDPDEWQRGSLSRAFARRAGAERVPDGIRLRTRRGQQGRDAWSVIKDDREEYLRRIAALRNVDAFDHVDVQALSHHVADWPWGRLEGPPWVEHVAVDRLLSASSFAAINAHLRPDPV